MEYLHSKGYTTTQKLARYFLAVELGERIQTFAELTINLEISRGTVQKSIQILKDSKAIQLKTRGSLGTYLVNKDTNILLHFAGINFIVGVMPLPYAKLYEGLGTGILKTIGEHINIPVNMAYMRGAKRRIEMVMKGRYDFAVVSKYAAEHYLRENPNAIDVTLNFGPLTFLKGHALIFRDEDKTEIEDGMKVGIDYDSIDQAILTEKVTRNKKVTLISLNYSHFIQNLANKTIDVVLWNAHEVENEGLAYNTVLMNEGQENTEAVLIVDKTKHELIKLFKTSIDISTVGAIQQQVVDGVIIPSY